MPPSGSPIALVAERPPEAFEQLDAPVRVVSLRLWMFLGASLLTLGSVAAFATLYQVPLTVPGRGILLAGPGGGGESLLQVTAPSSGRLTTVLTAVGATVRAGDTIAEIDQKEIRDELVAAEADLARLREEDRELSRFDRAEEESRASALAKVEEALRRTIDIDRNRLADYRRIAAGDRSLNQKRLLSDAEALRSRAEADAIESAIGSGEAKMQELVFDRLKDQTTRRREKVQRELAIHRTEIEIGLLRDRLDRETRLLSPHDGKVIDLRITPHALVEKGSVAALLQPRAPAGAAMEAIVFVPAGRGKKIRVGDPVEILPDTALRQEQGFIRGEVRSISEIPATDGAMLAELKHPALVAHFSGKAPGEVLLGLRVALPEATPGAQDSGRRNRLVWSSRSGASHPLTAGTLCGADVVVEHRPLIALAMPWVKHLLSID